MSTTIKFPGEEHSNSVRQVISEREPHALRTFTPSQAVLARSSGVFHWTPEGRRLYDYSSGVLVANLGHNPKRWLQRLVSYLGWTPDNFTGPAEAGQYVESVPLTAYNAITEVESAAVQRLVSNVQACTGGNRLDTVMWAASGSEAIQKSLWACLHRDESRDMILATRHGFHGKKGLSGAVTGTEEDPDRDPRVRFISFPMAEVDDLSMGHDGVDLSRYQAELDELWQEYGQRINCLITEPYLGGGGSYHPPSAYLQLLQNFCRQHDVLLILDEVQSNFGRTGTMYAFEKHGLEPDFVVLGKGMGNGVPVNAAIGRSDVLASLQYGEGSDTWSANPMSCAAVLATLDEFENTDVLRQSAALSETMAAGLNRLKQTALIAKVRGEGMVFGIECPAVGTLSANEVANAVVRACYLGRPDGDGIHLLGPLAGKVIRVSPPMTMTQPQAEDSLQLFYDILQQLAARLFESVD